MYIFLLPVWQKEKRKTTKTIQVLNSFAMRQPSVAPSCTHLAVLNTSLTLLATFFAYLKIALLFLSFCLIDEVSSHIPLPVFAFHNQYGFLLLQSV